MNTFVTVLIPAYNRAQYIEECIRSVQSQSLKDLEILVIDDGSTDNTAELCRQMVQKDPRIRLLTGDHKGVSAARNLGLDAAQGKYIFFLDSDDVIHPMLLETLAFGMKQHAVHICGTKRIPVSESNWATATKNISNHHTLGETVHRSSKDVIDDLFRNLSPLGVIGGVMMQRDWIGSTRFRTDLHIGEDFYFIYENLIKGTDALYLTEKWYYARLHKTNLSWDFNFTGLVSRLLRRELVWKSEDSFGRSSNSAIVKREAFSIYVQFIKKGTIRKEEQVKCRQWLRDKRKAIMPTLSYKAKAMYIIFAYVPLLIPLILNILGKKSANK